MSVPKHLWTRLRIGLVRGLIAPLASWDPLPDPSSGYSLVLACPANLTALLPANLRLLAAQDFQRLERIFVVVDQPRDEALASIEQRLRCDFRGLPLEFLHFSRTQALVMDTLRWGWSYAWLSWCLGLAAARTQYVLIHDLDLLPLQPDFCERRYRAMVSLGLQYLGMERYQWNGFGADDHLMASNALMVDAAFLRRRFRPIDLFNRVARFRGRRVHFDLTLYPQSVDGRADVLACRPLEMVHPNQMICQFTALLSRRRYRPRARTSLLLMPYYLHLGGDPAWLDQITTAALRAGTPVLEGFFGRRLDLLRTTPADVQTLAEMAYQVERRLFGAPRPEVLHYFGALDRLVGGGTSERPGAELRAAA